jgi:hypothetical protein
VFGISGAARARRFAEAFTSVNGKIVSWFSSKALARRRIEADQRYGEPSRSGSLGLVYSAFQQSLNLFHRFAESSGCLVSSYPAIP